MESKKFQELFIKEVELTELDLEFPFFNDEDTDCEYPNEVIVPESKLFWTEGVPSIELDHLLAILNNLKKKGANRVYIGTHVDHHGYYIYGVKLIEVEK